MLSSALQRMDELSTINEFEVSNGKDDDFSVNGSSKSHSRRQHSQSNISPALSGELMSPLAKVIDFL